MSTTPGLTAAHTARTASVGAHERLAALFPFPVNVSVMAADGAAAGQTIAQRRALRRRELLRGRTCAQRALEGLGVFGAPVERRANGAPHWPDGVIGSISHTRALCAALVARTDAARSLGLDIEPIAAAPPELAALILATGELAPIDLFGADNWLTAVFSAKEAFYKCHFPLHRSFLNFTDWRTTFRPRAERFGTFTIAPACTNRASPSGIGFWCFDETNIYTGYSMPPDQAQTGAAAFASLI